MNWGGGRFRIPLMVDGWVFLILSNINKKETNNKAGSNEELLIWSQSIFKYLIAQGVI